eukprot:scaffold4412_cov401-Prasinococcus_capsulatus_cf.AAC.8
MSATLRETSEGENSVTAVSTTRLPLESPSTRTWSKLGSCSAVAKDALYDIFSLLNVSGAKEFTASKSMPSNVVLNRSMKLHEPAGRLKHSWGGGGGIGGGGGHGGGGGEGDATGGGGLQMLEGWVHMAVPWIWRAR